MRVPQRVPECLTKRSDKMPEWRPVGVKTRREKKIDFQCAECNKGNVGKWSAKMAFSAGPHLSSAEIGGRREGEKVGGRRSHPEAAHRDLHSSPKGAAPEWATNTQRTPNHMVSFWPTIQLTHATITAPRLPLASPIITLPDHRPPAAHHQNKPPTTTPKNATDQTQHT